MFEKRFHGEFGIEMKNGQRPVLNRAYPADVERVLGQSLWSPTKADRTPQSAGICFERGFYAGEKEPNVAKRHLV
jgi:hypothetical protein